MYTIKELIEDLATQNAYTIHAKYLGAFEAHKEKFIIATINQHIYYRARIGNYKLKGAIDDLNIDVTTPYFSEALNAPPPLLSKSGRFNREGFSFLYLASTVETCVAEIKLEVGQICSVGKFKCTSEAHYLDLRTDNNDSFLTSLKGLFVEPIHSEIKRKYLITQFISDIFREMGYHGIIYSSTQGDGYNIVCFYPDDFEFMPYSDKMYKATKITYELAVEEESYKRYRRYERLLDSYNSDEEEEKERVFDYINEKISEESSNLHKRQCIKLTDKYAE